jgi:hypothetical protein
VEGRLPPLNDSHPRIHGNAKDWALEVHNGDREDADKLIESPPIQSVNNSRVGIVGRPLEYAPLMYISKNTVAGKLTIRAGESSCINLPGNLTDPAESADGDTKRRQRPALRNRSRSADCASRMQSREGHAAQPRHFDHGIEHESGA